MVALTRVTGLKTEQLSLHVDLAVLLLAVNDDGLGTNCIERIRARISPGTPVGFAQRLVVSGINNGNLILTERN
jgi:hypothetical protein